MRLISCCSAILALAGALAPPSEAALPYTLDTRVNGTGTLPIAFDIGGARLDVALGVFKASDGGYWVAGYASEPAGVNGSNGLAAAIAKLTPNGALDTTFSDDGRLTVSTIFTEIRDVTIDAQQRFVFTGPVREASPSTGTDFAALRILPTGVLDVAFGFFGYVSADLRDFESPESVAVWPNGMVAVAGSSGTFADSSGAAVAIWSSNGIGLRFLDGYQSADAPRASATIAYVPARNAMVLAHEAAFGADCGIAWVNIAATQSGNTVTATSTGLNIAVLDGGQNCARRPTVRAVAPALDGSFAIIANEPGAQNDGRIDSVILSTTPSGLNLDPTFNAGQPRYWRGVAPRESVRFADATFDVFGRLVVTGVLASPTQPNAAMSLQRFSANGAIDPSFTTTADPVHQLQLPGAGVAATPTGSFAMLFDGTRVLAAGFRIWSGNDLDFAIGVWREDLLRDGFESP